MIMEFWGN